MSKNGFQWPASNPASLTLFSLKMVNHSLINKTLSIARSLLHKIGEGVLQTILPLSRGLSKLIINNLISKKAHGLFLTGAICLLGGAQGVVGKSFGISGFHFSGQPYTNKSIQEHRWQFDVCSYGDMARGFICWDLPVKSSFKFKDATFHKLSKSFPGTAQGCFANGQSKLYTQLKSNKENPYYVDDAIGFLTENASFTKLLIYEAPVFWVFKKSHNSNTSKDEIKAEHQRQFPGQVYHDNFPRDSYAPNTKLCFFNAGGAAAVSMSINPDLDLEYVYHPPYIDWLDATYRKGPSDPNFNARRVNATPEQKYTEYLLGESFTLRVVTEDLDFDSGEGFFYVQAPGQSAWQPLLPEQKHVKSNLNPAAFHLKYTPPVYGEYKFKFVVRDKTGLEGSKEWPVFQVHAGPDRPTIQMIPEAPMPGQTVEVKVHLHDANGDLGRYTIECWGFQTGDANAKAVLLSSNAQALKYNRPRQFNKNLSAPYDSIYTHDVVFPLTDKEGFDHYEVRARAWDIEDRVSEEAITPLQFTPLPPSELSDEEIADLLAKDFPDLFKTDELHLEWRVLEATAENELPMALAVVDSAGSNVQNLFEKTLQIEGGKFVESDVESTHLTLQEGGISAIIDFELGGKTPMKWVMEVYPNHKFEVTSIESPFPVRLVTDNDIVLKEKTFIQSTRSIELKAKNINNNGLLEAPRITLHSNSLFNSGRIVASDFTVDALVVSNYHTGFIGPRIDKDAKSDSSFKMYAGKAVFNSYTFTNAGNLYGSFLELNGVTSIENQSTGLIHGDESVLISGKGKLINAGTIKSINRVTLNNNGFNNTGLIASDKKIFIYNQAAEACNAGRIECAKGAIDIRTTVDFNNTATAKLIAQDLSINQKRFYNAGFIQVLGAATVSVSTLENAAGGLIRDGHFNFNACGEFINEGQFQPETLAGYLLPIKGSGIISIARFDWEAPADWTIENSLACRDKCSLNVHGSFINKGSLLSMSEGCIGESVCKDDSEFTITAHQGFVNEKKGLIGSTGVFKIDSHGDFKNIGRLDSKNNLHIASKGNFINPGSINGVGDVTIHSDYDIVNQKGGEINMAGALAADCAHYLINDGIIKTDAASSLKGNKITNNSLIDFHDASTITCENLLNAKAKESTIQLAADSLIDVEDVLENHGNIRGASGTVIKAGTINNIGAASQIFGSSDLSIIAKDDIDNIGAEIIALGLLDLQAKKIINHRATSDGNKIAAGKHEAARIIASQLKLAATHLLNQASIIYSYEDLIAHLGFIQNEGVEKIDFYTIKGSCHRKLKDGFKKKCDPDTVLERVEAVFEAALMAGGDIHSVLTGHTWPNGTIQQIEHHQVINKNARIVAGKQLAFTEEDINGIIDFYNGFHINAANTAFTINLNRLYKGDALHTTLTTPHGQPFSSKYLTKEQNSEFAFIAPFIQGVSDMIERGIMDESYLFLRPSAFSMDTRSASLLKNLINADELRFLYDPVVDAAVQQVQMQVLFGIPQVIAGTSNMIEQDLELKRRGFNIAKKAGLSLLPLPYKGREVKLLEGNEEGITQSQLVNIEKNNGALVIGDSTFESGVWVISNSEIDNPTDIYKYYSLAVIDIATGLPLDEDPLIYRKPVPKSISDTPFSEGTQDDIAGEQLYYFDAPAGKEVLIVPMLAIPKNFQPLDGTVDLRTLNLIAGGTGVTLNLPHADVHNSGTIASAAGPITLSVSTLVNEKPVFFAEQTVSGSSFIGKSFSQTYELRIPQPGGEIIGVNITIESTGDVKNIGGTIATNKKVRIFSQKGDIINIAQDYSTIDMLDVGTLGGLLGRNPAVLRTYLVPGTIIGDERVDLNSEEGRIIMIASRILGDGIELKAGQDIDVTGRTIVYDIERHSGFRGTKVKNTSKQGSTNYPSVLISQEEGTTLTTGGSITLSNTQLSTEGKATFKAEKDVIISPEVVTKVFSTKTTGMSGLNLQHVHSRMTTQELERSFIYAKKGIHIEAGQDNILEAAFLHAGGLIYIKAGRDNIIKGATESIHANTKGFSIGVSFFGSDALNMLLKDKDADAKSLLMSIADEDPLINSLDQLSKADGGMDITAQSILAAVQVYKAMYLFNKVNAGALSAKGAIGQRLGLTDAKGNVDPRITVSLDVFKSSSTQTHTVPTEMFGKDIEIISGRNTEVIDGSQIIADETLIVQTGGNFTVSAGNDTFESKSQNVGGSVGFGGGVPVTVGVHGSRSEADGTTYHNAKLQSKNILITVAKDMDVIGGNIAGESVIITAHNLHVESLADTAYAYSIGGSIDTGGNVSFNKNKKDSANVGTQSSIVATYMASIDVDDTITLIGALIAAPEERLNINAETLVVQVVEEYSREKGFGFSASIPTDRSGDVTQGDGVNAVVGGSVLNDKSENVLYSTITPGNLNIKNGIPANLNRDINNLRSTPSKHKTYVRVVVPIIDGAKVANTWSQLKQSLISDGKKPNPVMGEVFEQQVATLLSQIPSVQKEAVEVHAEGAASVDALNEETDDVENINADERTEPQAMVESLLGDSWQGNAAVFIDELGESYLAHKGSWLSESGSFVEGAGVIKIKDLETYDGFKSLQNGEVNVTFLPEANALRIDTVANGNHFTQTQSVESFFKEAIMGVDFGYGNRPGVRIVNIQVETFIAAKVLKFGGLWAGDDRGFDEPGSYRTFHTFKILFENGIGTIIDEMKATGITHKLDSLGQPIETGQASGETLKFTFDSIYRKDSDQSFYRLNMEADECNPLIDLPQMVIDILKPGITYDLTLDFDSNGQCLGGYMDHDRFPSTQIWVNGKPVYQFSEADYSPWWFPKVIQPILLFSFTENEKSTIDIAAN